MERELAKDLGKKSLGAEFIRLNTLNTYSFWYVTHTSIKWFQKKKKSLVGIVSLICGASSGPLCFICTSIEEVDVLLESSVCQSNICKSNHILNASRELPFKVTLE